MSGQNTSDRSAQQQVQQPSQSGSRWSRYIVSFSRMVVMVLSLLLITYISYDTFENIPFLTNRTYMRFQLWVCIAFMADFFIEFAFSQNKLSYLKHRWLFLLISIPYLNLIRLYDISMPQDVLYYLRFVPLIRGAYALVIVVGYVSTNRATTLLTQYVAILLTSMYIGSLLFYYQEVGVNPNVTTFWSALYWTCMYVTTIGGFSPVTIVGKVISVLLPILGTMMLPLITVFFTDKIQSIAKNNISK